MGRKLVLIAALALAACSAAPEPQRDDDAAVLAPVKAFYAAYDEGFTQPADYATDDWNHINPLGGRTHTNAETLATVRNVHTTFLKDATDTIETADVRFASDDVAVVTVLSKTSAFAQPGETEARARQNIRTFVVVKRDDKWLVMQDHNTEVRAQPPST